MNHVYSPIHHHLTFRPKSTSTSFFITEIHEHEQVAGNATQPKQRKTSSLIIAQYISYPKRLSRSIDTASAQRSNTNQDTTQYHHNHSSRSSSSFTPALPLSQPTPTFATSLQRSMLLFLLNLYCRSRLCSSRCLNGASLVMPSPPSSISSLTSASLNPRAEVVPRLEFVESSRCRCIFALAVAFERTRRRRSRRSATSPSPTILPLRFDGGVR